MTTRSAPEGTSGDLFSQQPFKLGLFGTNLRGGLTITTAENTYDTRWDLTKSLVQRADAMGFELVVPVGRWKGFGGPSDFHGSSYETFTWAAGLAAVTQRAMIVGTIHVPIFHPLVAAKMAATVDHISNGRFGLNIVAGWNEPEFEMFGAPLSDHAKRYAQAIEWVENVVRLWTDDEEYDFDGEHYTLRGAISNPKPIRKPHPTLLYAGGSDTGRRYAAKYADILFVSWDEMDTARKHIEETRRIAREEFNRELQVFAFSSVVCRATEKEARDYYHHYVVERGDWVAGEKYAQIVGMNTRIWDEPEKMKERIIAGLGAYPLIGTPEQVAERLQAMSDAGYDGTVLLWADYEAGLEQWERDVMPLLVERGLRT